MVHTERRRAAYHEAGHVAGWLSSPFELPAIYAITIEPNCRLGLSGEVRHNAPPSFAAPSHQLAIGRALGRGKLAALTKAVAAVSADLRAQVAGPVAEALYSRTTLPSIEHGESDFWNAYELAITVGLDPEQAWRREARRARRWLRRRWSFVEHLARALLCRPPGRRTLAGAPLSSMIDKARREVVPPFLPRCYEAQARTVLAEHRRRWRPRAHWVVVEQTKPRGTAVAWASDRYTARATANTLTPFTKHRLVVAPRRAR